MFPDFPYGPAVGIIVDAEGASAFRELIESGAHVDSSARAADRMGGYAAMMTLAVDYLQAMRLRVPMRRALDELLARYDALVAPTRGAVAPPIGYDFDAPRRPPPVADAGARERRRRRATIPAGNLAGLPALCVPNGFGAARPADLAAAPGPRVFRGRRCSRSPTATSRRRTGIKRRPPCPP